MRAKLLLTLCVVVLAVALVWLGRFRVYPGNGASSQSLTMASTNLPGGLDGITNNAESRLLREIVEDYHSTNFHASITSAITHEMIAEKLKTNQMFLEWATNTALETVVKIANDDKVPIYGTSDFSTNALKFERVTIDSWNGVFARAIYDPNPTK